MNKLYYLLLSLSIVTSCDVHINTKEEFHERATLRLRFEDQAKSVISDIDNMNVLVYTDSLFSSEDKNLTLNTDTTDMVIIRGVAEREYHVFIATELFKGEINTDNKTITQPKLATTHEPVRVGYGSYYVKRGDPISSVQTMILQDLFLKFEITINGAIHLSAQNDFELVISNVPYRISINGEHDHEHLTSLIPILNYNRNLDVISSEFYTTKFCANEDVTLTLRNRGVTLVKFDISRMLSSANIDMSKDNIVVPITMNITPGNTTIKIKDFELPPHEFDGIGN